MWSFAAHLEHVAEAQSCPVVGPPVAEHLVVQEVVRQPADLLPEQAEQEGAAYLRAGRSTEGWLASLWGPVGDRLVLRPPIRIRAGTNSSTSASELLEDNKLQLE